MFDFHRLFPLEDGCRGYLLDQPFAAFVFICSHGSYFMSCCLQMKLITEMADETMEEEASICHVYSRVNLFSLHSLALLGSCGQSTGSAIIQCPRAERIKVQQWKLGGAGLEPPTFWSLTQSLNFWKSHHYHQATKSSCFLSHKTPWNAMGAH